MDDQQSMLSEQQKYLQECLAGLEHCINKSDYSSALYYMDALFKSNFPCKIILQNLNPILVTQELQKKMSDEVSIRPGGSSNQTIVETAQIGVFTAQKIQPNELNTEIFELLKSKGHTIKNAKYAATGVNSREEAMEKLKTIGKK